MTSIRIPIKVKPEHILTGRHNSAFECSVCIALKEIINNYIQDAQKTIAVTEDKVWIFVEHGRYVADMPLIGKKLVNNARFNPKDAESVSFDIYLEYQPWPYADALIPRNGKYR